MAGGHDPDGRGLDALRDRLAADLDRRGLSPAPVGRGGADGPGEPRGRHVWVSDAHAAAPGRRAGLLVEWERRGGGWWGRVVVAVDGGGVLVVLVPARRVERA